MSNKKISRFYLEIFFSLSKNPGFQEEKTGDLAYMGLKIVRM